MKNRIIYIVEWSGLTKTAFGKRINVSQGLVSQMCSGTTNPSDRTIQDICREFGVNEVWLRTGEGEPFKERTLEEIIMRIEYLSTPEGMKAEVIRVFSALTDDQKMQMLQIMQDLMKKSDRIKEN